ncbi:alpha-mannosidase [Pilibacter termitis]|uniref:Alpha-mannosidase n=1 Tax=Pilibacter termitis TaxID=263852 RepID=A0A1T4MB24_9ENTE|nr:alpha-mannosidase [Pilibacter termitis]SJZ63904.1 alpha-mannosidase [Pilibacter termitis]
MKKKVYIISHSHLDREWYMPYEQHHMRVVELFDELIHSFETDPSFKYFHLDGQTIPLDDYFEVKPENRGKIERFIQEGRLKIGPFYILQDDFLISSESNVRNAIIGMKESKKYGNPVKLGYFPDTFGNMGQTPQMMRKMGLDAAAFGRGVKPTGLNNMVADSYSSQYSEMNWKGPDDSEIFGLLFANWYSNGNEIPTTEKEAREFWDQKLADAEKFASTRHLLMMNGCDHQPLQKDVGSAIALANTLYPEYEFVHSHFEEYLEAVKSELPENLATVTGELTSQETEGWYTLANTASSRVYLKQENVKTQSFLENQAEVIATFASVAGRQYPAEVLEYAWKYLLQNHPHDSICGCSVDEVHREMSIRFAKSSEVAKYVIDESMTALSEKIDTSCFEKGAIPFIVANTSNTAKTGEVEVTLEIDRVLFKEAFPRVAYETLENKATGQFVVVDSENNILPSEVCEVKVEFGYDLPKDAFRVPYMKKVAKVKIYVKELPMMSVHTFALKEVENLPAIDKQSMILPNKQGIETPHLKVEIAPDGSLSVENKKTGKVLSNLLVFEDVGDIGNEYIFKQSEDFTALLSTDFPHEISVERDTNEVAQLKLTHKMNVPISAEELLQTEREKVIDITNRKSKRSEVINAFTLETLITVYKDSTQVHFETKFNNQHKDHRLRVLFPSGVESTTHFAESIYETVERDNHVSSYWKNPSNPQHQHGFVNLHDEKNGLTIGNVGLNEYEVLPDENVIALTLLRSVGEMGDWGYFPTPEAQCLGEMTVEYSLEMHDNETYYESLSRAVALKTPMNVKQTTIHQGSLATNTSFVTQSNPQFLITCVKESLDTKGIVVRGYNLSNKRATHLELNVLGKTAQVVNLLEETMENWTGILQPAEILTTKWS